MANGYRDYIVEFSNRDRIGQKRMRYEKITAPSKKSIKDIYRYKSTCCERVWTLEQFEQLSDEFKNYVKNKCHNYLGGISHE